VALGTIAFVFGSILVAPGAANAKAGTPMLNAGEQLKAGQFLQSPDKKLTLNMQADGNLVLYAPGSQARWNTHTRGHKGAFAAFQTDGNLVVYAANKKALWHSFANGGQRGANRLILQSDGNLVEYTKTNAVTWNTGTSYFPAQVKAPGTLATGHSLQSPDGRYRLIQQGDGNLVFYGPNGHWLWNTNTDGKPANRLAVQADGNMVIYTKTNKILWQTATNKNKGGSLQVQNDGNVVLYTAAHKAIWNSKAARNIERPPVKPPVVSPIKADAAIAYARAQIGKPYKWAAVGPNSFDCSGLTMMSWRAAGVSLPRTSQQQYNALPKYPYSQAQKGDLIFFGKSPTGIFHVAIYSGNGQMVEAPMPGLNVREKSVRTASRMGTVGRPS
jgi:cell wall-associated NlpC family hydrolase